MTDLLNQVVLLEQEADAFGFRWSNTQQIMRQIESECLEIREHLHVDPTPEVQTLLQEEIGDLLHATFSLCVFCKIDPKETLEKTLTKFERRLTAVKQLARAQGLDNVVGHAFEDLMRLWDKAKLMVDETNQSAPSHNTETQ